MNDEQLNRRNIHWFPGHMTRTLRSIEKRLPAVDAVVQLLDARIPRSSLNPELSKLYGTKPRLYILNKSDLADPALTKEWLQYFEAENSTCVALNSRRKGAAARVRPAVEQSLAGLLERRKSKGMSGAKTRLMITGIPNVGKSTFINSWAGGARTKAADKPGVTRGEQWISAGSYELLDMPGVLWKKFENMQTAVNLALIGSIPDRLLNVEEIASSLLKQVAVHSPEKLHERYKIDMGTLQGMDGWEVLSAVGEKRGMLISGGEVDTERAAIMVLDEFRGGKLGQTTLEAPGDRIIEDDVEK